MLRALVQCPVKGREVALKCRTVLSMKAGTLENKKEKTPPVGYSIPMLMRHYCGLAQPASPIVCADSGLRAIPGVNQVMP